MARDEQHREDLLAEATGLVERASLQLPGDAEPTVIGFRRTGSLSIYFGQDRVYQFTTSGALRRAHLGQSLYKAEAGRLIAMRRERDERAVNLVSTPLALDAQQEFLAEMSGQLARLRSLLAARDYQLVGQVPAEGDVPARVLEWLSQYANALGVADSPGSA